MAFPIFTDTHSLHLYKYIHLLESFNPFTSFLFSSVQNYHWDIQSQGLRLHTAGTVASMVITCMIRDKAYTSLNPRP